MRHQRLLFSLAQTLFHGLFDAGQAGAVLVFSQLAHTAHPAIAQVIDVVHFAATVAQVHQDLHHRQDVVVRHDHGACGLFTAHTRIELHPSDT